MADLNRVRTRFRDVLRKAAGERIPGLLGDSDGVVDVPNRPGWDYVRVDDVVMQAYNQVTTSTADTPVWLAYQVSGDSRVLQVNSVRMVHDDSAAGGVYGVPEHALTHRFMAEGGGNDPVFVELRQWMPLRITAVGFSVSVYPGTLPDSENDTWQYVSAQTIDLTSYVPTTTKYGRFVLVYLVGTVLTISVGPAAAQADLTWDDIPSLPKAATALGAVYLYEGQSEISESQSATDLVDLRWPTRFSAYLDDLLDVGLETPVEGQVLAYDADNGVWINTAVGNVAAYYEPLTNGDASSPALVFADGDVIMVEVID